MLRRFLNTLTGSGTGLHHNSPEHLGTVEMARNDGNQDQVYAYQAFARDLNEFAFRMRPRSTTTDGEWEIRAWMGESNGCIPLAYRGEQ
jgi:hypothetical protein